MSDRLAFVRDYLAKKPEDRFALYSLGMELRKLAEWPECFATFDKLLALHPDHGAGYYAYGSARRESGDRPGARAVWTRGLAAIGTRDPKTSAELEAAIDGLDDE